MTAVILAGGRARRLSSIYPDVPKALVPVDGVPVLQRQLCLLHREGVRNVTLLCGYLAEQIESFCGRVRLSGMDVRCIAEKEPLGTAGALAQLELRDDFFLLNGDLILDVDLHAMLSFHRKRRALATLFVHPSTHPTDSTLVRAQPDGRITAFLPPDAHRESLHNIGNAGLMILSPALLRQFPIRGKADLDRDLLSPAVSTARLFAYKSFEYVRDMGTPERLQKVGADVRRGVPAQWKRDCPKRAVFLDRDGTLNIHKGYITAPDAIELLPCAAQAICRIHDAGYLAVLATNQPVVARGECSMEMLDAIHGRLEALLGERGAYLDALYVCPHHPDRGFPGEIPQYKIDCDCRKPKPGLLLQAARDWNIDLSHSYMVGDSPSDVGAAQNAGCIPVLLAAAGTKKDGCLTYPSLIQFAQTLG